MGLRYFTYLLCCICLFGLELWSILDVKFTKKFWNVEEGSVIWIICCIDSGIFWTGIFEMPVVYITVDRVADRSLERAVCLWRYV